MAVRYVAFRLGVGVTIQSDALRTTPDAATGPAFRAPRKVNLKTSLKRALRGLLSPARLWRAMKLHRARRSLSRTSSDEGLKL